MQLYPADLAQQLDFDHIRQSLAQFCQNQWAREQSLALAPLADKALLFETLAQTDQVLALLQGDENFPSTEYTPVEAFLPKLLVRNHLLREQQFAALRSSLLVYAEVYRFLEKKQIRLERLWQTLANDRPEKSLPEAIDAVIDEKAQVRTSASPALARIRKQLIKSRITANRIFDRSLKKFRDKGFLADIDETVSENRRVLAIQSGFKGQVNGIFHGSSAKQSITYIEPGESVEINNMVAELQEEEQLEIERILRALTKQVAPYHPYIKQCLQHLNHLDLIRARALFAHREEAVVPAIREERVLRLRDAHNPVLRYFNLQKNKETIPLSLDLDPEQRLLVISGPNAGGKSLSLKTVGLLQLMLQSGLPVPVHRESEMCLFDTLFGDIGDAQSIENELSTYSSKLEKMRVFLEQANDRSLLLIDEFGSGSDPDLGAALAQVFLEKLNRFGSYGILTTHFNAIKALAAESEGVANAAMLFDRENFRPRYLLHIGQPGSSFTFEVAQKSGIAPQIIAEARKKTKQETLQVDRLLVQIQDDKMALEKIRIRQTEALQKLTHLQTQQKERIAQLEEKLQKLSRKNEDQDRILYWGQRFQKLVVSWMDQKTQKDKKAVVARFIALLNQRAGEVEKSEQKSHRKQSKAHRQKVEKYTQVPVALGQSVRILDSGLSGTLMEKQGDKFRIALGGNLSTLLERQKFVPAEAPLGPKPKKKSRKKAFPEKGSGQTSEAPSRKKEQKNKPPEA